VSTPVDPSNRGQLGAWDGGGGAFWVEYADHFDRGVAAHVAPLLAAAAVEPDTVALDVGCGSGLITREVARRAPAGSALGVDLSSAMLALARRRAAAEGLANLEFRQADAQVHPFAEGRADVVVSRHGTMFFGAPVAAFANLARALRPGGRLALLTWQPFERNEWLRTFLTLASAGRTVTPPPADAPGPFAQSDPDRVRDVLTGAGFVDVDLEPRHEPMDVGADPEEALRWVVAQQAALLDGLDERRREEAVAALRADLTDHLTERGVLYGSATWLIRARRP
jgi:SAM-dependent methyltransferase